MKLPLCAAPVIAVTVVAYYGVLNASEGHRNFAGRTGRP
jgi:hypothetical protein